MHKSDTKSSKMLTMVINVYIILAFIFCIIYRYHEKTNTYQFPLFIFYFTFAIIIGIWGGKKYKLLFNPLTLFSLFIIIVAFSFLRFSSKQNIIQPTTLSIINISIVSFIFPFVVSFKLPKFMLIKGRKKSIEVKKIYNLIMIMTVCVFFIETVINRSIPIIDTLYGINSYTTYKLVPMLHYFINLCAIIPGISYFLYKRKKIKFSTFFINNLISIFIVLNTQSRQLLLLVVIMISFSIIREHYSIQYLKKINTFLIITGLIFSLLFVFLGGLRSGSVDMNELLTAYAHIDNVDDINLFEIWFNLYGPQNITTLDEMVIDVNANNAYTFGIYTFKPIISLLLLDRLELVHYIPKYDGFKSLATYIWEPFIDFGVLGVLFMSFIFGLISKIVFENFVKYKTARTTLQISTISYCILLSGFTNYYLTFFIWLLFILSFIFPLEDSYS